MDCIVWQDYFSVGVREMDKHHRQIIAVINSLITMSDANVGSELISEALTRMTQYASMHFASEEQLMAQYKYPDCEFQKEQHRQFRKHIADFCMQTMNYRERVPDEMLNYLKMWWLHHILKVDMNYKDFFARLGVA